MDTLEIDTRRLEETPPPQVFSPMHDDWHSQATSQQQYHLPLSELVACPWRRGSCSNDHRDGNAGFCSPGIYGSGTAQDTPPDDSSSPSSLGWSSHHGTIGSYGTLGSYGSSNTSYSQTGGTGSGSIDPISMERGSPLEIFLTGMPLVASPDELVAAASSPTLFHHQSGSAAQVAVHTTHPTDGYFVFSPPPSPHQPTHYGDEAGAAASRPNSNPYVCCGVRFGRRTDMKRHQRTTKKHIGAGGGHGPTCPVKGCKFALKFTRDDNFMAHCRKQHRMDDDEIDTYLRERKYRKMP